MENGQKVSTWNGEAVKEIAKHVGEMAVENQLNVLQGVEDALTGFHKLVKFVPRIRKSLEKNSYFGDIHFGYNDQFINLDKKIKPSRCEFLKSFASLDPDDPETRMITDTFDLMESKLSPYDGHIMISGRDKDLRFFTRGGRKFSISSSSPGAEEFERINLNYERELKMEFEEVSRGNKLSWHSELVKLSELLQNGYLEYWKNPLGEMTYGTTPEGVGQSATNLFNKSQMGYVKRWEEFASEINGINLWLRETALNEGISEEKYKGFKDLREQVI